MRQRRIYNDKIHIIDNQKCVFLYFILREKGFVFFLLKDTMSVAYNRLNEDAQEQQVEFQSIFFSFLTASRACTDVWISIRI